MGSVGSHPWVVVKFGGTSVANADCWSRINQVVKKHLNDGRRPLIVCSAPSGVSNLLESLLQQAIHQKPTTLFEELQSKYFALQQQLAVDCAEYLQQSFSELEQLVEGIRLTGEVTPRMHARVMAFGELMLTHMGAAYLKQQGVNIEWQDVREWLRVEKHDDYRHPDAYLSARCGSDEDADLKAKLAAKLADVVITQGFIATNHKGETVLLGRGGSDSSAAYLAAKLAATACEIWTDVPGIYTANPKMIPEARLITRLDYDEAQEIASMGAKVLHPKCLSPVKAQNIPLYIRYTPDPERVGTEIHLQSTRASSQIKSILTKSDIILISIETMRMWQQVGFLAEVFQCFKRHGLSIDLISSSEATVTVSLDGGSHAKDSAVLDALLADLNAFARAKVMAPCASVSLVGRNIRAILHQLGGVFSVFEEQQVHLLTQAANDLNLTFVVDEDQAPRLAAKLHHLLIEQNQVAEHMHLSWQEEFGDLRVETEAPWWKSQREQLLALAQQGSAQYVYSPQRLQQSVDKLQACDAVDQIFYSIKANSHADILQQFYQSGLGLECVSIEELHFVLKLFPEIDKLRISFTPNFAAKAEYEQALALGVCVTLDSLYPFQHWPELFAHRDIFIRVDIGKGSGHHRYVVTGGDQSKFGIPLSALDEVQKIAAANSMKIIGLHSHAGSGILNPLHWQGVFNALANLTQQFPDVGILNLGGGLGIVERPGQRELDLQALNQSLLEVKANHPDLQVWLEPGRYLVASAGVLLAKVTQVKRKGDLQFVGLETGMNSLIRPALYGSYHEIVNLTRLNEPKTERANIVGPICESGDTLGYSRYLPQCKEGDVMLIANVGAYGYCMSSHYNLREPAQEVYFEC